MTNIESLHPLPNIQTRNDGRDVRFGSKSDFAPGLGHFRSSPKTRHHPRVKIVERPNLKGGFTMNYLPYRGARVCYLFELLKK